ncbi:DUF4177 domain-containing protein [Sulfitobacter sp. G21635-S1]|uniref:DUF4177 domain-containing protein n=1 Tax=Sulfitobacter sp. G21635-S1 TaxID=3014043 RepID=UPI0022B026A4|nr:DUF4177 domain-containing protein [Sulfitobacter sp. G21635-S1]MCZ4255998.1 DUF4177 domain-containing protein [Sulfitobacter sp. G21635-S1]
MPRYEYKVVPAPSKGRKGKGVKGAEARFSYGLQELMNELAGEGWEYQRAETLPSVERAGLTSTTTEWRNVLVFRRLRNNDAEAFSPELLPAPAKDDAPGQLAEKPAAVAAITPAGTAAQQAPAPVQTPGAAQASSDDQPWDNGVEDTSDVRGLSASLEKLAAARKPSDSAS